MTHQWSPTLWGRRLTRSAQWQLRLVDDALELTSHGQTRTIAIDERAPPFINKGLFWSDVTLAGTTLGGLTNAMADSLKSAIADRVLKQRQRQKVATFNSLYALIRQWLTAIAEGLAHAAREHHWITHEHQQVLLDSRPELPLQDKALWQLFKDENVQAHWQAHGDVEAVAQDLKAWKADWPATWKAVNEQHTRQELLACKALFDRVEKKPLTEEQARAVICFDNRVQVVASAGSGKTSTMVAKAAYALHRNLMKPHQIVLLAFNKQAADELKARAALSFQRLGMSNVQVEASTFHALGLHIIGQATGRKPDIPTWAVDTQSGLRKLSELIEQLKGRSLLFRAKWEMFRLVFGRHLQDIDTWDAQGNGLITTQNGEQVRSQEECMIANWLFYNGVDYAYERPYQFDTATPDHRQYKPDFYYPAIGLYHEHLALDANGQPPAHFEGYLDGVIWKRQLHQERETDLIETTSWQLRNQDWMAYLSEALTQRGIVLKPDPERPTPKDGQAPMQSVELIGLVRTFISHAKSNSLTPDALTQRLEDLPGGAFKLRYRMFLQLVEPIMQAWDQALAAEDSIDFEDMLNLAAQHLEQGRHDCGFELVLADEFQDASRARARLCRALVQQPGRHLFAVGDDWQSINRFAGADVSVMTGFEDWFGHGQVLKLERTFRCPQALCDISSGFISKNPAQIDKQVRSDTPAQGPVLQALQVKRREELAQAIDDFLQQLYQDLAGGWVPCGANGKVSVFILGRYNADRVYLPDGWHARYGTHIELSFLTIHRSKGSEADYVILPAMVSSARRLSFPNTRTEDPVLSLAMPGSDDFALGEERRLFYVALTRARRSVALFTVQGMRSGFVNELIEDKAVALTDVQGQAITEIRCPRCNQGAIVTRTGRYGDFKACSNYPACEYKPAKNAARSQAAAAH